MNSIASYEIGAASTATYPDAGLGTHAALRYVTLGMVGEIGEIAEKVKKSFRDEGGVLTAAKRHDLALECGDFLWYTARAAAELNIPLSRITGNEYFGEVNVYEAEPEPDGNSTELEFIAFFVAGIAEWVGEVVAMTRRRSLPEDEVIFCLGCAMWNLTCLVETLGSTMEVVAHMNYKKLISRKERDVIGGSGDNR